jgi:hypothetical protein
MASSSSSNDPSTDTHAEDADLAKVRVISLKSHQSDLDSLPKQCTADVYNISEIRIRSVNAFYSRLTPLCRSGPSYQSKLICRVLFPYSTYRNLKSYSNPHVLPVPARSRRIERSKSQNHYRLSPQICLGFPKSVLTLLTLCPIIP